MTAAQLLELQRAVTATQVSDALLDYVQALVGTHARVAQVRARALAARGPRGPARGAGLGHDAGAPAGAPRGRAGRPLRRGRPSPARHRASRRRAASTPPRTCSPPSPFPSPVQRAMFANAEAVDLRLDLPGDGSRGAAGHARPAPDLHPAHEAGLPLRAGAAGAAPRVDQLRALARVRPHVPPRRDGRRGDAAHLAQPRPPEAAPGALRSRSSPAIPRISGSCSNRRRASASRSRSDAAARIPCSST